MGNRQGRLADRIDRDTGARATAPVQQPFIGQHLQGLVHRGPRGAEFDGQVGLVRDAVALAPFAVKDPAPHFGGDGLGFGQGGRGGTGGHIRSCRLAMQAR